MKFPARLIRTISPAIVIGLAATTAITMLSVQDFSPRFILGFLFTMNVALAILIRLWYKAEKMLDPTI